MRRRAGSVQALLWDFFICSSCIRQRSWHWHRREINALVLLEDISLCSALQKSSTGFFALGHPRPSGRERGCKKTEPLSPALRSRSANPQAAFQRYFCVVRGLLCLGEPPAACILTLRRTRNAMPN